MRRDFGLDALVSAGDEGVAFLDLSVDATIPPGPIGMLADQAYSTRNEYFHTTPMRSVGKDRI